MQRARVKPDSLQEVRSKLVNRGLTIFSGLGVSFLAFFLVRMRVDETYRSFYNIQSAVAISAMTLTVVVITLLRKQLTYSLRAGFFCGLFLVDGIIGLWVAGIVGAGYPVLITGFIMSALLFRMRTAVILVAVGVGFNVMLAVAHAMGYWGYPDGIADMVVSAESWVSHLMVITVMIPVVFIAIGMIQSHFSASIRRTEELQQHSEMLFEQAPMPTLLQEIADEYSVVLGANKAACELFGWSKEELQGLSMFHLVPKEAVVDFVAATRSLIENGTAEGESVAVNRSGEFIPIKFHANATLDVAVPKGVLRTIVTIEDIRERKAAETALIQSEKNYRDLFNSGNDAIMIHDTADGAIVDVNNTMLKMFECSREDVVGKSVVVISSGIAPYTEAGVREKTKAALGAVEPVVFEWQAKTLTGRLFWVEVNIKPVVVDGTSRLLSFVRDIDERKRASELLIQSEKMLSVGGLAAGIAHEINNPLAGISQSATVLKMRLTESSQSSNVEAAKRANISLDALAQYMEERKIPRIIDNIHHSVSRATEIVSNMLNFARKSDAQSTPEQMNQLLDETITLAETDYNLKKQYDFRHIAIERHYSDSLPSVLCQAGKIQQVFYNILRNGAEAMIIDEQCTQPTFALTTSLVKSRKRVRIEIRDNGPGIPEEVRKHIFEPFFTTKPPGMGTGLGLSISYFIIADEHRGSLEVFNEGSGTCFVIELPCVA